LEILIESAVGADKISMKRKSKKKLPIDEKRVTRTEITMVVYSKNSEEASEGERRREKRVLTCQDTVS
jgi:hypothetical protein